MCLFEELLKQYLRPAQIFFVALNLGTALPGVTELCALLLTIPAISVPVKPFFALKRVFVYLHSTETYESLAKMLQQMR
jgi:hypothetical protein